MKNIFAYILALLIVLSFIILISCDGEGTIENREEAAREILSESCDMIQDAAGELAGEKLIMSYVFETIASNSCNCIIDIIIPGMAEKYTLSELKDLLEKPVKRTRIISEMILEKRSEVIDCLTF